MYVFEWDSRSAGAEMMARLAILEYLERERSEENDPVLTEALLSELLSNVAKCGVRRAKIAVSWRDDGAALLEVLELEPGPERPDPTPMGEGWGLMVAGALNDSLTIVPGSDGGKEHVRAVLPLRRKQAR